MNKLDHVTMVYADKMLEINNAEDMDYGDKTGAFMAIARQIISDTAKTAIAHDLDLEDLV